MDQGRDRSVSQTKARTETPGPFLGAIPGKVRSGFPSGMRKNKDRAGKRFRETLCRSSAMVIQGAQFWME
ncbi:hypothetical protein C9E91_03930 [Rhizobium sp. SEMIA4064]|nr:hypothetical protein C9E91_03930 [Rhizobium sp. SEMIA4064]